MLIVFEDLLEEVCLDETTNTSTLLPFVLFLFTLLHVSLLFRLLLCSFLYTFLSTLGFDLSLFSRLLFFSRRVRVVCCFRGFVPVVLVLRGCFLEGLFFSRNKTVLCV